MGVRVPILQTGSVLIASVQEELTDSEIVGLQGQLLQSLIASRSTGIIIDVSALDVIDSFSARTLVDIASAVQLRGANMVIVGIQPEVALAMVLLGISFDTVTTALNLDRGISALDDFRV